jgi:hypothetical protein
MPPSLSAVNCRELQNNLFFVPKALVADYHQLNKIQPSQPVYFCTKETLIFAPAQRTIF